MTPTAPGQRVKFVEPLHPLEAEARFVVREIFFDVERPRAIVEVDEDCILRSTHVFLVEELELVP